MKTDSNTETILFRNDTSDGNKNIPMMQCSTGTIVLMNTFSPIEHPNRKQRRDKQGHYYKKK